MPFKQIQVELKADVAGRTITGYAATFGNRDSVGDIVEPGAFSKTISERQPKKLIKLARDHRTVIGLPTVLAQDAKGLYFEGAVDDTECGNETLTQVKSGSIAHASFAYDTIRADMSQDGIDGDGWPIMTRHLTEVKLYDVGPVGCPANEDSVLTGVKEYLGADDPAEIILELPRAMKALARSAAGLTSEDRKLAHRLIQSLPGVVQELQALLAPESAATPPGAAPASSATPPGLDAKCAERLAAAFAARTELVRALHA